MIQAFDHPIVVDDLDDDFTMFVGAGADAERTSASGLVSVSFNNSVRPDGRRAGDVF